MNHKDFYDIHGDDAVSSRLATVTHEELYQLIKDRLLDEFAEAALVSLGGVLNDQPQPLQSSQG